MNSNMQKKGIIRPVYFEPEKISDDEEFKFIDNSVVNNIIEERYLISKYGRIYDTFSERFISITYDKKGNKKDGTPKGYQYCSIKYRDDNNIIQSKKVRLNRAVAISFDPKENMDKLEVNHIDGDHSNGALYNLQWSIPEENKAHALKNRLYINGENHHDALLTNEEADIICKMIDEGIKFKVIADKMNVCLNLISDIKRGHSYRHISEKYKFRKSKK